MREYTVAADGHIILGDITKPGFDYRCEECAEIFEVRYGRDEKPFAVTCPVCDSGRTSKLISMPTTRIWWKNPKASSDASGLTPKHLKPARNRATRR